MIVKFGRLKQEHYKGMLEKAAFSLHSDIMRTAQAYLKPNATILDIACGEGAFTQRLLDHGFSVDACELDIEQVKVAVKNKIKIDLNQPDYAQHLKKEAYDAVCAIEIIEHIENPWNFFRIISHVLKPGGIVILSTPNVSSFPSRLRFFMRGKLMAFEKPDLAHGHITPLPYFQLENLIEKNNFLIRTKTYGGTVPLFHFTNFSRFELLRNTILPFFTPFMSEAKFGRSLIYILEKK